MKTMAPDVATSGRVGAADGRGHQSLGGNSGGIRLGLFRLPGLSCVSGIATFHALAPAKSDMHC